MDEQIIITYESFAEDVKSDDDVCIKYDENKSLETGIKCYKIRDFDELKPQMKVHYFQFNGCLVDKDCLYYCMPCLREVRDDVTYKDGTVVSVRWKIKKKFCYKGFYGGIFVVPMMKIIFAGRFFCIRFYEDGVHVTGKFEEGVSEKILEFSKTILENCYLFWKTCVENEQEFLAAVEWIAEFSKKPENKVIFRHQDGKKSIDYQISWPRYVPQEHHWFITEITDRYTDVKYVSELFERSKKLLRCSQPSKEVCVPGGIFTCLVRYSYNIGMKINIPELVKILEERGYRLTDHDAENSNVQVYIVDKNEYEDDFMIKRKDNKIYTQNFSFLRSGKIQHCGTGFTRHKKAYMELMKEIVLIYG